MKRADPYTPVGCSLIDYIEIFATEKKKIELIYMGLSDELTIVTAVLKTWETKDKVEYLVTMEGLSVRLDKVFSIGGVNNVGHCVI